MGARGVLSDIDDVKSAQLVSEKNRAMLDQLFHRMNQGVVYHDSTGNVIRANPAAFLLLGMSMEQLQSLPIKRYPWYLIREDGSRIPMEDYPPLRVLRTGVSIHDEVMGIVKSSNLHPTWVLVSSEAAFHEDEAAPYHVFTTFTDITAIKEAKMALELQMEYTQSILQAIPDGILIIDTSGRVLDYKPSVVNSPYYSKEMLLGYKINEILPSLDFDAFKKHREVSPTSFDGDVENFEVLIGGSLHFLEARLSSLRNDKFLAVVRDDTIRHQAQLALNESTRKMNVLLNNLRGVAFRCRVDADWTMEFISNGILELTGFAPDDFIENRKRSFESITHEDDRLRVRNEAMATITKQAPYTVEYRIYTADHDIKWVWEKGQVFVDDDQSLYLEGFITDITDKKRVELELIQNEEKYRSLVESLDEAIVIVDPDGTYRFVSD